MNGAGGSCGEGLRKDVEGAVGFCVAGGGEACGGEDGFEFACAYYCVDFGDVLLDFVAVAFDEAAGYYDAAWLCRRSAACAGPSRGWC